MREQLYNGNGIPAAPSDAGTPPPPPPAARRVSQHRSDGTHSERSASPPSRAGTPASHYSAHHLPHHAAAAPHPPYPHPAAHLHSPRPHHHLVVDAPAAAHSTTASPLAEHHPHLPPPAHLAAPRPHALRHSPSLPALHLRHASPGPSPGPSPGLSGPGSAPLRDPPHTPASVAGLAHAASTNGGLASANAALRTQVSELELVNGLYQGRVRELKRAVDAQRALEHELRGRLAGLEREVERLRGERPAPPREAKRPSLGKRRFEGEEEERSEGGKEVGSVGSSPHGAKRSRRSDGSEAEERREARAETRAGVTA